MALSISELSLIEELIEELKLIKNEWKLWLPSDMILDVIDRALSPPMSVHAGIAKTLAKLRLNFFWPNMAKQVKDFVSKCEICRQCKAYHKISNGYSTKI